MRFFPWFPILIVVLVLYYRSKKKDKLQSRGNFNCPRCLGKGYVDEYDIVRLKRETDWLPGKCMYCSGKGLVPYEMKESVAADELYLNTSINDDARSRFIAGDPDELKRAAWHKLAVEEIKEKILELHSLRRLSPDEIATELIQQRSIPAADREKLVLFINNIITYREPS